jgi:hypothetical protein
MPLRPRLRSTAKWAGLALCLLTAGIWLASTRFVAGTTQGIRSISAGSGRLTILSMGSGSAQSRSWNFQPQRWTLKWGFARWDAWGSHSGSHARMVQIPLWAPLLLLAVPTALLWRLDAVRWGTGCQRCRYDLSGLPATAACPECGRARA